MIHVGAGLHKLVMLPGCIRLPSVFEKQREKKYNMGWNVKSCRKLSDKVKQMHLKGQPTALVYSTSPWTLNRKKQSRQGI